MSNASAEIAALKSSSAVQPSYAGVTRQASSATPEAARQPRSAPSGTSQPHSSGAQSGTGGGAGRQQNALRWCRQNELKIKSQALATKLANRDTRGWFDLSW